MTKLAPLVLLLSIAILAAVPAPAAACSPFASCMDIPQYASCANQVANEKAGCNNAAGPLCSSVCAGVQEQGACMAGCLTSEFSTCENSCNGAMSSCYDSFCFFW